MKKKILLSILFLVLILVSAAVYATVIAFTKVKPAADNINRSLSWDSFSKTVAIPKEIPPPSMDFNETAYLWEMVTPQNETTAIRLKYNPAFSREDRVIKLTLEMPGKGDPSIFNKVLPAIITDKQSLEAAQNPQEAQLSENKEAGYKSLNIQVLKENNQVVRFEWEFNKDELKEEIKDEYGKLEKYPKPLLGFLYGLPSTILRLLAA